MFDIKRSLKVVVGSYIFYGAVLLLIAESLSSENGQAKSKRLIEGQQLKILTASPILSSRNSFHGPLLPTPHKADYQYHTKQFIRLSGISNKIY